MAAATLAPRRRPRGVGLLLALDWLTTAFRWPKLNWTSFYLIVSGDSDFFNTGNLTYFQANFSPVRHPPWGPLCLTVSHSHALP